MSSSRRSRLAHCCRACAACAPAIAASAAMPPLGLGATDAVRSSPGGSACGRATGTGVMRRAEAGGQPSRLSSEGAGCADCWCAAPNCWPESRRRSGVGVMRLAALPRLAADSAGRPLLLAAEAGAAGGPTGSATMRRGAFSAPAPPLAAAPLLPPIASGTMRRPCLAAEGAAGSG